MKKIYLVLIAFFAINSAFAQLAEPKHVSYYYDAAGNRTVREIQLSINKPYYSKSTNNQEPAPIEDKIENHEITIYPNPTKGNLVLKVGELTDESNGSIEIFDLNGKQINESIEIKDEQTKVDLSKEPSGIYFMNLNIDGKNVVWKIIKE